MLSLFILDYDNFASNQRSHTSTTTKCTLEQQIEQVKVKVAGKLNALPVPFEVKPDLACGNYGFDCPLKAGEPYKFRLTLPILRTYPKLNVNVFLRLLDEKGDLISCVEMPARIQEPQKPL